MVKYMGITGDMMCENQKEIKWKITNFPQFKETDLCFKSAKFSFSGVTWNIWIFPNGLTKNASAGWIGLYLAHTSLPAPVTVDLSLSFKTSDGKIALIKKEMHKFDKIEERYGWSKFVLKSMLIDRQSEFLPSGILTLICTMKNSKINDVAGNAYFEKFAQIKEAEADEDSKEMVSNVMIDAFAQTEEETDNEDSKKIARNVLIDTFAQTEEETGVWSLQKHLRELFLNGTVSDVVMKADDQEFKSHRCILAARSPVFLAMMTRETEEKNSGVVNISDVDASTFSDFLYYLYSGSVENITQQNVLKLYPTADKYQVDELKKVCADYMLKNISVDSFCDILSLSLIHVEKDLTDACFQFFIENSLAIALTSKWQIFLRENPTAANELFIKQLQIINKRTDN